MAPHRNFRFRAENGFFEFQGQVFAQIGTALRAAPAPSAPSSAKEIAETEEVAEDVAEILEHTRIEARRRGCGGTHPGVSEAIVKPAFFLISQNRVGFAAFLELFLCVWIIRIAIGMVLKRKFTIGAFDLHVGGGTTDAQNLVVITFAVRCRNESTPYRNSSVVLLVFEATESVLDRPLPAAWKL